jgi:hypothetical protein
MKINFEKRPLSWSQVNSFLYDPKQWYDRYILGKKSEDTPELIFGKRFSDSIIEGKPLAPITLLPKNEFEFQFRVCGIKCIGFADGFDDVSKKNLIEYKTGVKEWTHDRVKKHGQIDFYLLANYVLYKIKPEDVSVALEWIPTKKIHTQKMGLSNNEYSIDFATNPPEVVRFETKRTLPEILTFAGFLGKTIGEMQKYVDNYHLHTVSE